MNPPPKKTDWLTPQSVGIAIGILSAIAGAWMSFDSRISRVESSTIAAAGRFDRIERTNDRIENKIDRLLLKDGR